MPLQLFEENRGKVLVVEADGQVTKADYECFLPKFARLVRQRGKSRVLFDMTGFRGWDAVALWGDINFDPEDFSGVSQLALLGKAKWQTTVAACFRPFTSAAVRYFHQTEGAAAGKWLGES